MFVPNAIRPVVTLQTGRRIIPLYLAANSQGILQANRRRLRRLSFSRFTFGSNLDYTRKLASTWHTR